MTNPLSPLELTQSLIQKPSITPLDYGCQQLLIQPLQTLGFTIYPLRFGNVENFYARLGSHGKNFCFAGHTDVVTAGNVQQWHCDPFKAEVHNGILTGRGANDMKGGLAAMLTATQRFLDNHPTFSHHNSLSFLITGDEEGDATHGTVKMLQWLKERQEPLDYCLVGEPTNLTHIGDGFKCGRRGSLNGELIIHGLQGHVAYPHLATNPIHQAAPLLDTLANLTLDQGNDHFPATCLQFTNLHAGDGSSNVIPADLKASFNIRFSPESSPESLEQQLHDTLKTTTCRYTLNTTLSGLPFLTKSGPLLQAISTSIETITGITPTPSTGGGTSDARFISQYCPQTVEFGLLSPTIHKVNEQLAIADLETLTSIYEQLLQSLFPNQT